MVSYAAPARGGEHIAPAPAASFAAPARGGEYIAPAPTATYAAPAPVVEYIAPAPAASYDTPALVVEYIVLAPAASYAAPAPHVDYITPAPAVPYITPAPDVEYIAPAPAVSYATPAPDDECIAHVSAVNAALTPVEEFIAPSAATQFFSFSPTSSETQFSVDRDTKGRKGIETPTGLSRLRPVDEAGHVLDVQVERVMRASTARLGYEWRRARRREKQLAGTLLHLSHELQSCPGHGH